MNGERCCPGAGSMAHVRGCVNHPEHTPTPVPSEVAETTAGEREVPTEIVRVRCPHREGLAYRDGDTLTLLPCDCNDPSEVVEVVGVGFDLWDDLRRQRNEWRRVAVSRRTASLADCVGAGGCVRDDGDACADTPCNAGDAAKTTAGEREGTCPSLCVERSHPGREHDETTDGCYCWELCAMGPTCPGANAGLERGCWRATTPAEPDAEEAEDRAGRARDWGGRLMNICEEYDHAAVVMLVDGKPQWKTTPQRIHVSSELAADEGAGEFLRTAYHLSPGCRPEVIHGDLIETGD